MSPILLKHLYLSQGVACYRKSMQPAMYMYLNLSGATVLVIVKRSSENYILLILSL